MNSLFIFNSDLRLRDNLALYNAAKNGESLTVLYIFNQKKWIILNATFNYEKKEKTQYK